MVDSDTKIVKFAISRPRNSFFSKLSELSSSKILIEVTYIPSISKYLVIAYSYNRDIGKYLPLIMQNNYYLTKSKIKRVKYFKNGDLHVIVAIKLQCEFLKIAENNNVAVLSPYIIDKGRRSFTVVGEKKDLEQYMDEVMRYYGEDNVKHNSIDSFEALAYNTIERSLLNLIAEKLTDMELNVIMLAYKNGYFNYPKDSSQETIGTLLGLSKITVNIHMRKALKKIIEEIVRASS